MLVFGLSISLIPVFIITTIYYFHAKSILKYDTFQDLKSIAQSKMLHVVDCINGVRVRTFYLSIDKFIKEKLKAITYNKVSKQYAIISLNKYLPNILSRTSSQSRLIAITVVDKSGKVISSTNENLIGNDVSHDEIFTQGISKSYGETFVSHPHFSSSFNTHCICISAPILPEQNAKPIGVIITTFNIAFLNEITTNLTGMGNTGEVYLVNKDGTMITVPKFVKNPSFNRTITTMPICKINEENKEWVGIYLDYRNIPVVGVSMNIPEYGWILVVKIDKSEAFASLKMLNIVVLTLGIICTGIVTSVGVIFALSTSKSIINLKDATERFSRGDLDYRINMPRNDEIGNLSKSFNIMAEELSSKINELRQTAEALRMSESKYRFLLDNLPLRIFYKDRNSVYISCNVNYARDLHIKPEEISGKTDYDFYPKELAEKYRTDDRKIMESGQKKDTDEKYFKDGQKLIIHTVRVPIKNEKGESIGILGSFLDITEKANLEKETQRSRNLALIGELAAGVAHEINNPATGVINCAQILLNKSREGSTEKDLACRIIKEGDRIATIVSKLLSFARPQEKKTITDMHEILFDTLVLIEKQLKKDCITIKQDIPNDLPEIFANPQQIQQVFMNIISNARYALNQKYPEIHENKILEISGEKIMIHNHPHIKITFCDHGTGIPANVKDKIMNPFFTTKPHGKGTGLGLSISHNIIHDHNGKLTIDSVEGEYTKVIITLPTKVKTIRGTA